MTYIDYINRFNQWIEEAHPPDKTVILYYGLLHLFNRRGWPEWAGIDSRQLAVLVRTSNKTTAYHAREMLAEAGLIEVRTGRKGKATEYRLVETANRAINRTENRTPNKKQTKTETKSKPPVIPPEKQWGGELTAAVTDWLAYKTERRQAYRPTGFKALLSQLDQYTACYGEAAVADLLRLCMANGWQGIVWDKLAKQPPRQQQKNSWLDLAEELEREEGTL